MSSRQVCSGGTGRAFNQRCQSFHWILESVRIFSCVTIFPGQWNISAGSRDNCAVWLLCGGHNMHLISRDLGWVCRQKVCIPSSWTQVAMNVRFYRVIRVKRGTKTSQLAGENSLHPFQNISDFYYHQHLNTSIWSVCSIQHLIHFLHLRHF